MMSGADIEFRNLDFTVRDGWLRTYTSVADEAIAWTRRAFPMLRGIHSIDRTIDQLPSGEMLAAVGYPDLIPVEWNSDGVYHRSASDDRTDGACLIFCRAADEAVTQARPVMFIRASSSGDDSPFFHAHRLAFVIHESGHLVDFENRLHLRLGEKCDLAAAETYAHRYTIRTLHDLGHLNAAHLYVWSIARLTSHDEDTAYRRAARDALTSDECTRAMAWFDEFHPSMSEPIRKAIR